MNLKTVIATTFRLFALVLTLAILLPSAIKLNHVFTHHKHEVCENDENSTTHFHEADLDCEFYNFKLTNTYYLDLNPENKISKIFNNKTLLSYYLFLRTHQQDTCYLRGPPALV
ncbi:hypothetical protein [Winogradskyella sp.]|uniref:hypothetical protein n=1 Tax=Winogradskyella sp. TaxID=1883156 RepID=UPI003F6ACDBA